MKAERIAYFTNKITGANKSEIICALYEIFFEYIEDAKSGEFDRNDSIRMAGQVLEHLKDALNFKYEISGNLFSLYDFCQRRLSEGMYKNSDEPLENAKHIMSELYESFLEVAKQDDSPPMMQNTQKVSAGYTYGRTDVMDSVDVNNTNRGFLA